MVMKSFTILKILSHSVTNEIYMYERMYYRYHVTCNS